MGKYTWLQLIAGLVENLTEWQGDKLQKGIKALGLGGGQGRQQIVLAGAPRCGHRSNLPINQGLEGVDDRGGSIAGRAQYRPAEGTLPGVEGSARRG